MKALAVGAVYREKYRMKSSLTTDAIKHAGVTSVGGLFAARALAVPDHIASEDGDRVLTYRQLDERTNRLAHVLSSYGLQRGDRVAILARNCQEYLETELAAAKLGVIVAALNWRLADRELIHCITLVEPRLILVQPEFRETIDRLPVHDVERLVIDDGYESALAQASSAPKRADLDAEDGLVILYTSGTTGLPKGALISHRAMIARAACFASQLSLPTDDHFVAWAPLYHMASTDHALATLMRGGTVHIVDGYQPDQLIDIVSRVPVGWFVLMPGMVGEFATAFENSAAKAKNILACGAMADLVPREQIAAATRALNAPYLNSFGATETGLAPATAATIPIGQAPTSLSKRQSAFCELRLVDPEDRDVADGEPGEVALRGPTLFSGYWKADETNAHDFRNGWFHMGDVMRRNPDGTLDYVDRVKYLIKSGGENIYPAEIEQVIAVDKRVLEVVVVRRSDEKWGEVPVAFIVANDPGLTEADVLSRCQDEMSSYKRPKQVIFIEDADLPRSTTGKIQRHELEKRV